MRRNLERIGLAGLFVFSLAAVAQAQCVTTCGKERWDIKTGCDAAAQAIHLDQVTDTTIAQLRELDPPEDIRHFEGRAAGVEDELFLLDATLTLFKSEADRDYHLVLRDHGKTMIAEIPNPECVIAHDRAPANTDRWGRRSAAGAERLPSSPGSLPPDRRGGCARSPG